MSGRQSPQASPRPQTPRNKFPASKVPAIVPFGSVLNRQHRYHDLAVTGFVEQARHAIAIDERHVLFPSVSWGDLTEPNKATDR
jgi:hypothetical protein